MRMELTITAIAPNLRLHICGRVRAAGHAQRRRSSPAEHAGAVHTGDLRTLAVPPRFPRIEVCPPRSSSCGATRRHPESLLITALTKKYLAATQRAALPYALSRTD